MINIFYMIVTFICLWIIGFVLHEFGHILGARLTGGNGRIKFWMYKGIPSLKVIFSGDYHRPTALISGGLTTGIVYLISAILTDNPYLLYPLLTIGFINALYSLYELVFIDEISINKYMIGHYVLYIVVGLFITGLCYLDGMFA
jgi:hypothetical protein